MRWLGLRLRVLLGALPTGLERLFATAFDPLGESTALATAIPWLLAALAAGAAGSVAFVLAGLSRDYPVMAIAGGAALGALLAGSIPAIVAHVARAGWGLQGALLLAGALLGGAAGLWLAPLVAPAPLATAVATGALVGALVLARRVRLRRWGEAATGGFDPVAATVWALALLTLLPALQAGAEVIITRATVPEFARRQVGGAQLIDIHGYALDLPFEAEPPLTERGPAAGTYRWLVIRDALPDQQMALIRTRVGDLALGRRDTLARVRHDLPVAEALAAMRAQRAEPDTAQAVGLQAIDEQAAVGRDVRKASGLGDVAGLPDGSLVRLSLDYPGIGVANCALNEACDPRRLGRGVGPWLHLATDGAGGVAVVQQGYPPTAAPVRLVGRQESDQGATSRFLDDPWNRLLLGWAQVQRRAEVEHDPGLPVDRLWLGPILFIVAALLLVAGRRAGYPVFDARDGGMAIQGGAAPDGAPRSVVATVSGWLSVPGRSPLELDASPGRLERGLHGTRLTVRRHGEAVTAEVPRALGALSGLESGALRYLRRSVPALRVGWYGSQLQMTFATPDERDAAIRLLRDL